MKRASSLSALFLAVSLGTPALAEDLVFTLTNGTSQVLTHFYTSPVGVDEWEEDVFGTDVLAPGESVDITIADGRTVCEYDMRFEFGGSDTLETTVDTQDLCALGAYEITE